jgi:hypothetical protein
MQIGKEILSFNVCLEVHASHAVDYEVERQSFFFVQTTHVIH